MVTILFCLNGELQFKFLSLWMWVLFKMFKSCVFSVKKWLQRLVLWGFFPLLLLERGFLFEFGSAVVFLYLKCAKTLVLLAS
jgi:hypothetical protein